MADGKVIIATDLDSSGAVTGAKKLGSQLKSGIGSAAGVAVKGIAAIGTASVAAGGAMVKFAKDTATLGDEIDKNSQRMGLSAEAYQKWDYALKISGSSIQNVQMGLKTLTNKLDDAKNGSEKAQQQFANLGLSMDDIGNKSREEVFEMTVKSLQNIEDDTKKAALANDMFGRSGQEMLPLLSQTNEDLDKFMKTAEDYGMVMSDEAVKASAEFRDSLTTMGQTFEGLKNRMVAEFLPSLTEVTDGLALIFKGDTEEGLAKIDKGIEDFVGKLSEIVPKVLEIGGKLIESLGEAIIKNLPKLIQTGLNIGIQLLNGILSALPQIIEMLPELLGMIGEALINSAPTLFTSILGLLNSILDFLMKEIPNLVDSIVNSLGSLDLSGFASSLFELLSKALTDGLPHLLTTLLGLLTSVADYISSNLPILTKMLMDLLLSCVDFIMDNLPLFLQTGLDIALGLLDGILDSIPKIIEKLPELVISIVDGLLECIPMIAEAGVQLLTSLTEKLPEIIDSIVQAVPEIVKGLIDTIIEHMPDIIEAGFNFFTALITDLPRIITQIALAIPQIWLGIVEAIIDKFPDMMQAGLDWFIQIFEGIPDVLTSAKDAVADIWDAISEAFDDLVDKMFDIGKNLINGLWDGISSAGDWLLDELGGFCDDVVDGVCDFFGISSPSKVMRDQVGRYLAEGIYVGFDKYNPMDKINADLKYGMKGIETSMTVNGGYYAGLNYEALGNAVVDSFVRADIRMNVDGRDFARLERGYA